MILSVVLYIWEGQNRYVKKKAASSGGSGINSSASRGGAGSSAAAGGSDFYVSPFLFAAVAFCIMRMISISVSLSLPNLLANMTVWMIFEAFGNILFLLAFTLVALCWCNIVIRADIMKVHFIRLKTALWVLWGFVAISLFIAMVCFVSYLPQNFGAGAHDYVIFYPNGTVEVGFPINNQLAKPQASIITATEGVHYSFMVEKGMYACYGFCLGFLFAFLATIIIAKLAQSNTNTKGMGSDGSREKKFRRTVFSILFVAIPVALTFAVIFIFVVLEVATHRHAQRTENYITQNLCSEIIALAVLLIHYWRARLRSYVKEKRESAYTSAGSARTDKSTNSGIQSGASVNSAASASGAEDEDEPLEKKGGGPDGKTIGGDFDQHVITL